MLCFSKPVAFGALQRVAARSLHMIIDFSNFVNNFIGSRNDKQQCFGTNLLSFESKAATIASLALFSPEETDDPIIAVPLL
jgi:hypothetical protein